MRTQWIMLFSRQAAKSNRCCESRCSRCSPGPEWDVPSSESAFETIVGSPQDASADFVPRNINSHPRKNRCTRPVNCLARHITSLISIALSSNTLANMLEIFPKCFLNEFDS